MISVGLLNYSYAGAHQIGSRVTSFLGEGLRRTLEQDFSKYLVNQSLISSARRLANTSQ